VKKSIRRLVQKLRRPVKGGASGRVPKGRAKGRGGTQDLGPDSLRDVTGQTVYGDRPLRFRNLTLTEIDLPVLDDPGAIEGAFKIRVARHTGAHRDAGSLVERQYAGRGYTIPNQHIRNPFAATFLAYDEGQIVGTVTVRLDSTERLGADDLYAKEVDALRSMGHRMCEFTRLAVDRTAASKPVLAGLFHTAYLYASVIRGYTHAVIEVNPRHVSYYGNALGFTAIGPQRMNTRVNAPAVLLYAPFASIAQALALHAGRKPHGREASRSLFVYGFPPQEEAGVLKRLRELVETD
jgi:hypothetical protein